MKYLLLFLACCGVDKNIYPPEHPMIFVLSNTSTDLEKRLISEVLADWTANTGISLAVEYSDQHEKVWEQPSNRNRISIESECTAENWCIRHDPVTGDIVSVVGYAITGIKDIFLLSYEVSRKHCEKKYGIESAQNNFKWTIMHEFGHLFGMPHDNSDKNNIMVSGHTCNAVLLPEKVTEFYEAVNVMNGF